MNKIYCCLVLLALVGMGCGDFLEYKDSDKIIPKELSHYDELVFGEVIKKSTGNEMIYLDIMTDDVTSVVSLSGSSTPMEYRGDYYGYYTWAVNEQLDIQEREINDGAWAFFYHRILSCNIFESDLMNNFDFDTEGVKSRLLGEIAFVRAMSYFYLVNLYGEPYKTAEQAATALGVPINTETSIEQKHYKRATLQANYDLIEEDLLRAIDYLKAGEQLNSIFRPNVDIARLFLSRIYLYQKKWQEAKNMCDTLLVYSAATIETYENMAQYRTNSQPLYYKGNPGIIFSWGNRYDTPLTNSTSNTGHWEVSDDLRAMYTEEDIRGTAFFYQYSPYYPYKCKTYSGATVYDWCYRIEEAYLNRAEACIELGEAHLQQALADINEIRRNRIAGDYEVAASNVDDARTLLRDEKRMEFCFEDSRWFDIRRWEIEITHRFHDLSIPTNYDTYVLPAGSANYILSLPLEVQRINFDITNFKREETLVN